MDRKEALKIARNANQELHKICDTDELYSEDIFWNPLEEIKIEEQQKIIELMTEYIKETDFITESYCYRREDCENVGGNRMCKECILDYFRKKAKGE